MFEYKGWITLSFDTHEEDFSKLKEQIISLENHINTFNSIAQFAKIVNCNENYVLPLVGVLNHENGMLKILLNLVTYISHILPASYGVIYYRNEEGNDSNSFFIIKLAKGKITILKDNILSPCFPTIED